MARDFVFTSGSVTEGHPDKLCDVVSDAVVDRFLHYDPFCRVICECAVAKGVIFLAVRFAANDIVDVGKVARRIVTQVGYDHAHFSAKTCSIMTNLSAMPRGPIGMLAQAADDEERLDRLGAQEQATLFGFACDQTPELMPLPIWLANRLVRGLARSRRDGDLPYLAPDGQAQVGVLYRDGRPARIHSATIVTATEREWTWDADRLRADIIEAVVEPALAGIGLSVDWSRVLVNPAGAVEEGGPLVHSGMTGRKCGADAYGEYARQSSSALSGKDPWRIDRTGAYAARHAAKAVVAAGLATECEVQLSYAIGEARPVSLEVQTFGAGRIPDTEIAKRLAAATDFRVGAVTRTYNLRLQMPTAEGWYAPLAAYGQMGRADLNPPWETTELAMRLG